MLRQIFEGGYRSVTAAISSGEKIAVNNGEELSGSFMKSTSHSDSSFDRKTGVSAVVTIRKKNEVELGQRDRR